MTPAWYVLTVPHVQGARVVQRDFLTPMQAATRNATLERQNSPMRWLRDPQQED